MPDRYLPILKYKIPYPQLEADLPFFKSMQGERFTAQVPPIVSAPCFMIRKKSQVVFSLEDYQNSGRLPVKQMMRLKA